MLIDTHAHLNFKAFKKDLSEVIKRANNVGVIKIIIPGAKLDSSIEAVKIAQTYPSCYAAVGIHPHHIQEFVNTEKTTFTSKLRELATNKKVVAIGEIGLDYHQYSNYPPVSPKNKKNQEVLFLLQISIAQEKNLPVIIHCRRAYDDIIRIIKSYIIDSKKGLKAVFHCFSGEKKHLRYVLNMGFYIGFDGNITYGENSILQDLVKYTPLDRLLLETDSPFLAPIKHRGSRNEPSYLPLIVSFIASLHKKKMSQISEITSGSALKLFNL